MATYGEADTPVSQVRAWIAAGECYDVEFKGEHRGPLNDRELVEAVVCLANGSGGVLLVGVEDDGTPTGARPRHESGRTDILRLQALIANNTQPPVATSVGIADLDGASVIVIEIPDSRRVVGTTRGTYLRRAIGGDGRPTCVPYHAHEMLAHEVDRGAVDYASLPVHGATWEDLDPLEFERVRRLVTEAGDRLEIDSDTRTPVRILTLDDVTVLRVTGTITRLPAGSWSGTLHLPHGQRPRAIPPDLADAARMSRRDLTTLDTAELRYALNFLDEATTDAIRRGRIDAIITALPTVGTVS